MRKIALAGAVGIFLFAASAQAKERAHRLVRVQTITVTNAAQVPASQLRRIERAIVIQSWQLRDYWHTPVVRFAPGGWPVKLAPHTDCISPLGSNQCAIRGAPGYHVDWRGGAEVSTLDWAGNPSWSVTFSHEVLELIADPSNNAYTNGYPREVCDVVETVYYRIGGVWVADFVTPAWFRYGATFAASVRLDWMGRVHDPGDDSLS